jgi:hypothetical protein
MPNNADRITVRIELDEQEYRSLMAAFRTMPKEAQDELRTTNKRMVGNLVHKMEQAAAYAPNPAQARLVARSLKANKDRVPSITVGGARRAPVNRRSSANNPKPTYGQLLFGTEFGAVQPGPNTFKQGGRKFPAYSGRFKSGSRGYFIFPTLRKAQPQIRRDFLATVDKVIRKKW